MPATIIPIKEGWATLAAGLRRAEAAIFGYVFDGDVYGKIGQIISTDDYKEMYTTVYTMCTQKPPNNWSENLYQNYCEAIKDYLSSRILPHIKEKHDESMLKELVRADRVPRASQSPPLASQPR